MPTQSARDALFLEAVAALKWTCMAFPIKTCVACGEEFELRPDKPGFANRCPECSEPEAITPSSAPSSATAKADSGLNAERRRAMRDLLYRKES